MTDRVENPTARGKPPNLDVSFGGHVTDPALQRSLERSITARVARHAREVDEIRAVDAARAKLLAVINAPVRRLIEQDSAAVKALDELRIQQRRDLDSAISTRENMLTLEVNDVPPQGDRPGARPLALAGAPPYEVSWTGFHEVGDRPSLLRRDDQTGEIKMRGATGEAGSSRRMPGLAW